MLKNHGKEKTLGIFVGLIAVFINLYEL